jgi:hypothetical protein
MPESVIKYSDLIGEDDTFIEIFANIEKLKKELLDLTKATQKQLSVVNPNEEKKIEELTKEVERLTKQKKELDKQEKKAVTTRKKLADLTDEELIKREKLKIANRERIQIAKQNAILQSKEVGQIERLRAQLALTTITWKKLTTEEIKNNTVLDKSGKTAKKVIADKRRLTEQLKKLEKQTGDTRRNVGNYGDALGRVGKLAARVFVGRSIFDGLRRIGAGFSSLIEKNKEFNSTLGGISEGFSGVSNALSFAGTRILEFLAPAINFVTDALTKLPAFFAGVGAAATQFAKQTGDRFRRFGLQVQVIFERIRRNIPFGETDTATIDANIARLRAQIQAIDNDQTSVTQAFNEAFDSTLKAQEDFAKQQEENEKREARRAKQIEKQNKLLQVQNTILTNNEARIKAIEKLQDDLEKSEADSIKDAQERAFRLEELRFEAVREAREEALQKIIKQQEEQEKIIRDQFGKDSEELKKFIEKRDAELLEINGLFFDQEILDLEQHEQNKLDIRKKFGIKTIELNTITLQDSIDEQQDKELEALEKSEAKKNEARKLAEAVRQRQEEDAAEKRKEREKELTQGIIESSKKIGEAIVSNFQKQTELATSLVEQQAEAVDTQRERAEQGLTNTLKFEQEQLAQREAERIRAQQKAQSAAKILTLFNLVAAYAGSGDTNALARGLVDFSLLTALETALSGFEEGGYTGSDARNDTVKGVVHANEFVLTAEQTKRYGLTNKTAGDFGEAMSDYYNQQSPLLTNSYKQQNESFSNQVKTAKFADFSVLEAEVRAMRQTLQKQQNNDFEVERMTDYFVDIAKRVTKNRMTTIKKVRKRL